MKPTRSCCYPQLHHLPRMEGASYSSMNKSLRSGEQSSSSREESGWTSYFEDFMASEKRKAAEGPSSSSCSSMVSDAASSTAWKPHQITGEPPRSLSNLRKKGRGGAPEDDSLEDTASSPVSSPKAFRHENKEEIKGGSLYN